MANPDIADNVSYGYNAHPVVTDSISDNSFIDHSDITDNINEVFIDNPIVTDNISQ